MPSRLTPLPPLAVPMPLRTSLALCLSFGLLFLAACSSDDSLEPSSAFRIELSESQVTLTSIGQNRLLVATISDMSGDPVQREVIWTTSDRTIVQVNGSGLLTATGAGSATVTASSGDLAATATIEVDQTPEHIVAILGTGQSGPPSDPLPSPLTVRVTDALNHPIAGVEVTFAVTAGGGSVDPLIATTDAFGQAAATFTIGSEDVDHVATATVTGTSLSIAFTARLGGPFDIEVDFVGGVPSASVARAFADAEQRWEAIITADVPDDIVRLPAFSCGQNPELDRPIDDLVIFATIAGIDGRGGILGQAGPCFLHGVGFLPAIGQMTFDAADLADLENLGLLSDVILHEMGHVLGYGTVWDVFGVLADPTFLGGTDPHFTGAQALAQFDLIGGAGFGGAKVPVENQGGPGTADGHWRESVFDNELMTGFINLGDNPLSVVSIASLADLGYQVDIGRADPFSILTGLRQPGPRVTLPLGNDVLKGPIGVLDKSGKVGRYLRH